MTGIIYSFALLAPENNVGRFISILRMQSTLNGGGKGEVFKIDNNITTFCQVIGSVVDVLSRIVDRWTYCPM